MFHSLLIANRGEIAVRICHTAKRMGIRTIAVYSEADTNALHVKAADDAVFVGPSPSAQSYLDTKRLMTAIQQSGADAVHPGYGFLSENEQFCRAVSNAGVAWVGPGPDAIRLMGDKIESKKMAKQAGVNTVPGTEDVVKDIDEARVIAKDIGYPVMIKAAAGGGGKGMRIARNDKELVEGMQLASSEAESSFNDARVFIEKYFDNPRHIEMQVLADSHGNVITLYERECSIQRRHQKVIEEAPSMFLSEKQRARMSEQSIALAKAVNYQSAGTVEYIVDDKGEFYFLEMNTRLQVEHRVTELITGVDLVEQMLRVANGEKLMLEQEKITVHGWAFESRIYAEDPTRGFLPSTGRITSYQEPSLQQKTLIDTAVYEGGEVSMYYDPMIAKVCTHATTRETAIETMQDALSSYVIDGVSHNISFLEAIYAHPRFKKGDISTNFIEQEYPDGFTGADLTPELLRIFMGAVVFCSMRDIERATSVSGQLPGRERVIGARWILNIASEDYAVTIRKREEGYDISYRDGIVVVRSGWKIGRKLFQGQINGKKVSVHIEPQPEGYQMGYGGALARAALRTPRVAEMARFMPEPSEEDIKNKVLSPIAGLVSRIMVEEGETVQPGQELCVIEAMKMENIIRADAAATVARVCIDAPQSVNADEVIIEFEQETT